MVVGILVPFGNVTVIGAFDNGFPSSSVSLPVMLVLSPYVAFGVSTVKLVFCLSAVNVSLTGAASTLSSTTSTVTGLFPGTILSAMISTRQ